MRCFASQLGSIRISLDPPSPPPDVSAPGVAEMSVVKELSSDMSYLQVPPEFDLQRSSSPPPDRRSSC
ncbi:unnamed protein product, partial [Strongylus vulgaris]